MIQSKISKIMAGGWLIQLILTAPVSASASVIVQFDFEDGDGGSYLEPRYTDTGVTTSDMRFETDEDFLPDSAGDTNTEVTFDDTFPGNSSGNTWNSIVAVAPDSSNGEDYLSFDITPEAGLSLNLDCINFMVAKSNDNGIGYYMRSNKTVLDITTTQSVGRVSITDNDWEWVMVDLNSIPELQGITSTITFDIVVDQAVGNVDLRFDKIEVLGTVVPEPSTGLFLATALITSTAFRRGRHQRPGSIN